MLSAEVSIILASLLINLLFLWEALGLEKDFFFAAKEKRLLKALPRNYFLSQ